MLCSTMLPAGDPLTIEISSFRPVPTRLNKNIRPTLTRKKRRKFMAESLRFISGQSGVCAVRIISHATGIATRYWTNSPTKTLNQLLCRSCGQNAITTYITGSEKS